MKTNLIYTLFTVLLCCVACSEDKEESLWEQPAECSTIRQLIENNSLLKEITEADGVYTLLFETQTITLNTKDIKDIHADKDNWKTTVTFPDNSTLEIPTVGSSIDQFIAYAHVDPSGYNPLAAEVRLNLPAGGAIRTIVHTKDGYKTPDIDHSNTFTTDNVQFITILGLYPDYTNQVEVIYADRNGNERGRTRLDIPVKELGIDYLPKIRLKIAKHDKMEPGMNLLSCPGRDEGDTSVPFMVDADGEIRWLINWNLSDLERIGGQSGLYRKGNNYLMGDKYRNQIIEVDPLGNVLKRWDLEALGFRFHHRVGMSEGGNILVTVSKIGAQLAGSNKGRQLDHIIEIEPETGTIAKEWDLVNMLDSARNYNYQYEGFGAANEQSVSNWAHNNYVTSWGSDDYLASARYQGIFKYDLAGNLKWVISSHESWRDEYKKYLLQPLDRNGQPITDPDVLAGNKRTEDFDWVWGVHSPEVLPNGHVIAFDNGYCRFHEPMPYASSNSYSRIVEYEIDEKNMTIRQVWEYGKERGRECYAPSKSNVQYLPQTGNYLFCPGNDNKISETETGGHLIEIDPRTNEVVYELEAILQGGNTAYHRATRMTLYPEEE